MGLLLFVLGIMAVIGLIFAAIVFISFWVLVGVFFVCTVVLSLVLGPGVGFLAAIPVTGLVLWAIAAYMEKNE